MIFRILILLLVSLYSMHAVAQPYVSDGGHFSIPEKIACVPYGSPIIVNAPECDGVTTACSLQPVYNVDNTRSFQIVDGIPINFEYDEPGTYIMRIQIGTQNSVFDQIEITILPNEAPDFDIYTCSGNRAQIEITDPQYNEYAIDYQNDATPDATSSGGMVTPFFTYPSSLPHTISVRPNYINCTSTEKNVTPVAGPFAPAPPIINELRVLEDNNIQLNVTTEENFYYQLDISTNSNSNWGSLQKVTNESSLQLSAVNPDQNYYCFRMGAVNICDGPAPTYTGGNVICSSDLDLTIPNDQMNLNWQTSNSGVNTFTLIKNLSNSISIGPAPPFSYVDTDVVCGSVYSYQLVNEYNGGIRSYSKILTGTAASNRIPATVDNISSVINGNSVDLVWLQDPGFIPDNYAVFRIVNTTSSLITTTPDPSYTDVSFQTGENICYQIQYKDICGNESLRSEPVCPVELSATLEKNNTVILTWNGYNGWADGVDHYEIEKYNTAGDLVETINAGSSLTYTDDNISGVSDQIYTYRIIAVASDGSLMILPSMSNTETIIKNPNLIHPTAFVPNSTIDENRTFKVFGNYINAYELKIFNRWGELIFESRDQESGWDGTFRGQRMPEGTYVFQAKVTDQAGRKFEYAGTVVLLKKG